MSRTNRSALVTVCIIVSALLTATFFAVRHANRVFRGKPATTLTTESLDTIFWHGTAQLEVEDHQKKVVRGTATCVHSAGLYIAASVPRGTISTIKLKLRPGSPDERVFTASVVGAPSNANVTLLRVQEAGEHFPIELGKPQSLAPNVSLTAFGFEAAGQPGSVRRAAGQIVSQNANPLGIVERAQLNVPVAPGMTGGPVVSSDGTLVGIIASPSPGAQLIEVASVDTIQKLLSRPVLLPIYPDRVPEADGAPVRIEAEVASFGSPKNLEIHAKSTYGQRTTNAILKSSDGVRYFAELNVTPNQQELPLYADVRMGTNVYRIRYMEKSVVLDGETISIDDIKAIQPGNPATLTMTDGSKRRGRLNDLGEIEINSKLRINLSEARRMELIQPTRPIEATIVLSLRENGVEIELDQRKIERTGARKVTQAVFDPVLSTTELNLDGKVDWIAAGGSGRYIVFRQPDQRRVAVYDLAKPELVGHLPIAEPRTSVTASRDSIFVFEPSTREMSRFDLRTLQKNGSKITPSRVKAAIPGGGCLVAGSASCEVLFMLHMTEGTYVIDQSSLEDLNVSRSSSRIPYFEAGQRFTAVSASADGLTVATSSDERFTTWEWNKGAIQGLRTSLIGRLPTFSADGRLLMTTRGTHTTRQPSKVLGAGQPTLPEANHLIASTQGPYFLRFPPPMADSTTAAPQMFLPDRGTPIAKFVSLKGLSAALMDASPPFYRLQIVPSVGAIAILSQTNDRLMVHRLDFDSILLDADVKAAFIESATQFRVARGKPFEHSVVVRSPSSPVTYKLGDAPPGMEIDAKGNIRWNVPDEQPLGVINVQLIVVNGEGFEARQVLSIRVESK